MGDAISDAVVLTQTLTRRISPGCPRSNVHSSPLPPDESPCNPPPYTAGKVAGTTAFVKGLNHRCVETLCAALTGQGFTPPAQLRRDLVEAKVFLKTFLEGYSAYSGTEKALFDAIYTSMVKEGLNLNGAAPPHHTQRFSPQTAPCVSRGVPLELEPSPTNTSAPPRAQATSARSGEAAPPSTTRWSSLPPTSATRSRS